uniref:Ig-like domain-containing protein n=1 Tax=Equus asinus TaxID=9793 RepID=A0A8C4LYZ5_EQUAS
RCCPGCGLQDHHSHCGNAVLTQPCSVSESLGQKATISCTRSSGEIGDKYEHWCPQHPGSAPTTMMYKDDQRPPRVLDQFSGPVDSSSHAACLAISGLQTEDEADYSCAIWHSEASHSDTGRREM